MGRGRGVREDELAEDDGAVGEAEGKAADLGTNIFAYPNGGNDEHDAESNGWRKSAWIDSKDAGCMLNH